MWGCLLAAQDLTILTDRLSKINEALARKTQARNEYDRTIQETEAAYMKVLPLGFVLKQSRSILMSPTDSGKLPDAAACAQARDCAADQEEADLFVETHAALAFLLFLATSTLCNSSQ